MLSIPVAESEHELCNAMGALRLLPLAVGVALLAG